MTSSFKLNKIKFTKEEIQNFVKSSETIMEFTKKLGYSESTGRAGEVARFYANYYKIDISHFVSSRYKKKKEEDIKKLKELIPLCKTWRELTLKMGYRSFTSVAHRIKGIVKELNLDTSHFDKRWNLGMKMGVKSPRLKLELILIKNSSYQNTHSLKSRLIEEKILINKCNCCGINSWEGKLLSLQLDHIDGDRTNNELSNLQLLCPNCHSQTKTWGSKKMVS